MEPEGFRILMFRLGDVDQSLVCKLADISLLLQNSTINYLKCQKKEEIQGVRLFRFSLRRNLENAKKT